MHNKDLEAQLLTVNRPEPELLAATREPPHMNRHEQLLQPSRLAIVRLRSETQSELHLGCGLRSPRIEVAPVDSVPSDGGWGCSRTPSMRGAASTGSVRATLPPCGLATGQPRLKDRGRPRPPTPRADSSREQGETRIAPGRRLPVQALRGQPSSAS